MGDDVHFSNGIADPAPPDLTAEDLEAVNLVCRWKTVPPPHADVLQLWHFWPAASELPLGTFFDQVRNVPVYRLATLPRHQAKWWRIMAAEKGAALEIEET